MPSPNSTSGTTQHVDAASAPRMPPTVRSRWVRSSLIRPASDWAKVTRFSTWFVIAALLHPVVATGSRENFDALDRTGSQLLDRRTLAPDRRQYRDHPIL